MDYIGSLPPWGADLGFPGSRAPMGPGYRPYLVAAYLDTKTGGYQPAGMRAGVVDTPQNRVRVGAARKGNAAVNSRLTGTGRAVRLAGV